MVVDLPAGTALRTLDGHPSTRPEKSVVVKADGRELRRPDGRGVEFASNGIALSRDGRDLYWQALTGKTLYRISTEALQNAALSPEELTGRIERVGESGVSDGLWIDRSGRLYVSAIEEDAVKVLEDGRLKTVVKDKRLRWPDSFAEGPDGAIYVTASRIQDMAWFKPKGEATVEHEPVSDRGKPLKHVQIGAGRGETEDECSPLAQDRARQQRECSGRSKRRAPRIALSSGRSLKPELKVH